MTTARYDRQIRLWGEEGQTSIQQTSVCVIGSSVVAAETLKNLVLAGIQSFHIVDDAIVNETDLGKNFFVSEKSLGKPRAEIVVMFLKELNNSVAGDFTVLSPVKYPMEKLLDYSIVISTTLTRAELMPIGEFLYEKGVPLIDTRVYGLTGYFRHCFKLHTIYHTHNEHPQPDLRLDQPFESLLKMNEENDLSKMDHERHSHTPYAFLVLQALDIWRQKVEDPKAFPETYKQRKDVGEILLEMRMPDKNRVLDEDNFVEAKNALNRILMKTTIPTNVRQVFEHELSKVENLTPETCNWFWILAAALKEFVNRHGVLPLSGQLPDMTSDSKRYARLLNLYRAEAEKHAKEVHEMAYIIIEHVYGTSSNNIIPFEQTKKFCKQAAFIGVQKGSSLKYERDQGILPILSRLTEPEPAVPFISPMRVCPLTWLVLIKATDNFYNGKKRFPGTNGVPQHIDAEDLARRVEQLVNDTQHSEMISKAKTLIPAEVINEICRYGAGEPHVIASILGGIVSQEAIKLATHQYVPVDDTFIYDGHTQSAETIRL